MKEKYKKENFGPAVAESKSIAGLCRRLGMVTTGRNFYTMKKYIKLHSLSIKHFTTKEEQVKSLSRNAKRPLSDVLVENSNYSRTHLKARIIKKNLIEYQCEKCDNKGEWQGGSISLQLDHKNGVNDDNRIENLRFLCPNCHSQTETYCRKGLSKKDVKEKERDNNKGLTNKQMEQSIRLRRVERPNKEELIAEIKELNFVGTGKKYGVSDNAIRKWCKAYNTSTRASDYRK